MQGAGEMEGMPKQRWYILTKILCLAGKGLRTGGISSEVQHPVEVTQTPWACAAGSSIQAQGSGWRFGIGVVFIGAGSSIEG